jgi:DNA-binding LacI/PurR family transcriptional regulator
MSGDIKSEHNFSAAGDSAGRGLYSAAERAVNVLRARIVDGDYPPGSLLPTERQLSLEIGISRPVIRTALTQLTLDGWISRKHGHRPRVATALLAHLPARLGDSLALPGARATPTSLQAVAAIMPMNPFYPAAYNVLSGVQRTLARQKSALRLILFDTRPTTGATDADRAILPDAERERDALAAVSEEGITSLIFWHIGGEASLPAIEALQKRGVTVVFVDRLPTGVEGDFVGVDNRAGAREAVTDLIAKGHRRIVHLTHPEDSFESRSLSVREREEGWRDSLTQHGFFADDAEVFRSVSTLLKCVQDGIEATDPRTPTAVFAVNDAWAHQLVEAAADAGIQVPHHLSVVGFDDLDRYSHRSPLLTTTYLPFESVGERAAELLLERRSNAERAMAPVRHVLLATTLVNRTTHRSLLKGTTQRESGYHKANVSGDAVAADIHHENR